MNFGYINNWNNNKDDFCLFNIGIIRQKNSIACVVVVAGIGLGVVFSLPPL